MIEKSYSILLESYKQWRALENQAREDLRAVVGREEVRGEKREMEWGLTLRAAARPLVPQDNLGVDEPLTALAERWQVAFAD